VFAIMSRGGARIIRTERAQRTEPNEAPIPAAEAVKLIRSGRAWDGMRVDGAIDLSGDQRLMHLPDGLHCQSLNVSGCTNLEEIPHGLTCNVLIAHNLNIAEITAPITVRSSLDLTGCRNLKQLPEGLSVPMLTIADCSALTALPESIRVARWLEVAGSGLNSLPHGSRIHLLWRGVRVDESFIRDPQSLTGQDVLGTQNVEVRRILLERIGYEKFIADVGGLVIDRDRDAGGERRLIRVPLEDDEDIVVVSVICPSTGHNYVLRVPPFTRSCRQATAWLAGFDNPSAYQPIAEA
jgi:hypothetical protein